MCAGPGDGILPELRVGFASTKGTDTKDNRRCSISRGGYTRWSTFPSKEEDASERRHRVRVGDIPLRRCAGR